MTANTQQDAAQPKRRWNQFGLRAMFVWVTVIGLLLAVALQWIAPAQQQRLAVQRIERARGSVKYADPPAGENHWITRLRNRLPRDFFDSVEEVWLRQSSVDADLSYLSGLPQLHQLYLDRYPVTDIGLAHIGGLKQLKRLSLVRCGFTDAGLAHLNRLAHLQKLWLGGTNTTDAGLAHLSKMTQLQELWLSDTPITDAGLAHLSDLTQLQWLDLDRTSITDAGLMHLCGLTQLEVLNLHDTKVTQAGAKQIEDTLPNYSVFR